MVTGKNFPNFVSSGLSKKGASFPGRAHSSHFFQSSPDMGLPDMNGQASISPKAALSVIQPLVMIQGINHPSAMISSSPPCPDGLRRF